MVSITSPSIATIPTGEPSAWIYVVNNPFQPQVNLERHSVQPGSTINDWMRARFPDSHNFPAPTFCVKNNGPHLRAQWDEPLRAGEQLIFVPAPNGWAEVIWYLVVLIVSVTVSLLLTPSQASTPDTNLGETPQPEPVYTLRGQTNENKLGSPIESGYGQFRTWPSYGASSYSTFIGNDSFIYQLFCLGHGKLRIEQIYVEDTEIEEFQNIEYEIIQPGDSVTLFPDNVYTSTEVGGVELFGPNEASFTDWTPGYVACPPLQQTTKIEVDVVLPRGMYYASGAALVTRTSTCEFQYRKIDDAGEAIGDWTTGVIFTKTLKTTTPQRYTETITVPLGRYEVRAVRTNNAELNHAGTTQTIWRGLRAYLPSLLVYPGVTMLAMKSKATNNLNDSASTRINLVATRKLSIWDSENEIWIDDQPTRNPVWAFCDVFRAEYGARLADEFLDLEGLAELAAELENEGVFFDWVFDTKGTAWETARSIAKIARGVPILNGSKLTIVRERPQVLPVAMFTPENIIRDSFNYEMKLREAESHDSIEAEYINAETWLPETVLCVIPGDTGDRPKTVKFPGCTNRDRAYRLGMYMRMCETKLRTNINFSTGLEGLLPRYGDLVAISHPLPRWGACGYVLAISGFDVTLSRDVEFTAGTHYILLRKKNGSVFGPAVCTAKQDAGGNTVPNVVTITDTITPADYLVATQNGDPATFMFGTGTAYARTATVAELSPSDTESVAVKCIIYDASVFAYNDATAPAISTGYYVPQPEAVPIVRNLSVFAHPTSINLIVITWQAITGVTRYIVESSNDGETWTTEATPTNPYHVLSVVEQLLYIRVSATNVGTGVPATWNGNVGIALTRPNNVAGTALATWEGNTITATWTALVTGAVIDGYIARWFTRPAGGSYKLARQVFVETNAAEYTIEMAEEDNAIGREVRFTVTAVNIVAESATAGEDTETNPAPGMPTGAHHVNLGVTGGFRRFALRWTGSGAEDLAFYRVWASSINGFPVSDTYVVYEGTDPEYILSVPATPNAPWEPSSPARYWRVAEVDRWGDEYTETAQIGINAVP